MYHIERYKRNPVVDYPEREWPNKQIEKAPSWCSVDLRDGNQALVEPMVVEEKMEMFSLLLKLGFKEIEIGFPAASQIEFDFLRQLSYRKMIPDDVHVQILSQCRDHLIKRSFEAIEGIPHPIMHIYNSTNTLQRDVVFHASREDIKQIAIDGVKMVKKYMKEFGRDDIILEYSPESFMGTELDFALEVCEAVMDEWGMATPENPVIMNLPLTVEMNTPNVYADQVEWMIRHFKNRDSMIISIHPHNDRGTGVAATELALLAGADRVEGTLFGNGERTGNVDILTVAYNMFSQGIEPHLNISNEKEIAEVYERCTKMKIDPRHPYAGELVYTAFSGSHQDAIKKGMAKMVEHPDRWEVPYLPIDPIDVGRNYDPIIRINSQSGKGGVAYILETNYSITMPKTMQQDFGAIVTSESVKKDSELTPQEIYDLFLKTYYVREPMNVVYYTEHATDDNVEISTRITINGEETTIEGAGNGIMDAFCKALSDNYGYNFNIAHYSEHAMEYGNKSKAITYIQIFDSEQKAHFGVGISSNIAKSSLRAIVSAVNQINK